MFILFILLVFIGSENIDDEFNDLSSRLDKLQNEWKKGNNFIFGHSHNLSKINILVTGLSGVGKSTLINSIMNFFFTDTGIGKPVTQEIISVTQEGVPIEFFDTPGIEIDQKKQKKIFNNIYNFIKKRHRKKDENNYVHCIWYCVNAESKRFQDGEIDFIKKISQDKKLGNIPIVIVLTQCIDTSIANKMIEVIKEENLNISAIIPVLCYDRHLNTFGQEIVIKQFGVDKLIDTTIELVPEILQKTLTILKNLHVGNKRYISNGIVSTYVSILTSTFPTSNLNFILTSPTNFLMCFSISLVYKANVSMKFIVNYIKWTIGEEEVTNESLSEALKPENVPNYELNNVNEDDFKLFELIPKITDFGEEKSTFTRFMFHIKEKLLGRSKNVIYYMKQLANWFKDKYKDNQNKNSRILRSTFLLGESFIGYVENKYLNNKGIIANITAEDIKNHIDSTYKNKMLSYD